MASERKPGLVIAGTLRDVHGRTVKVGHRGGDVEIVVTPHSGHDGRIALDAEQRIRFVRALAEAAADAAQFTAATQDSASDEIELLTYDQAVALLPDGDTVHTFLDGGITLIGADWSRHHVLELLRTTDRREVTGTQAQEMGHGLAAYRDDGMPVFIATRPAGDGAR